MRQMQHDDRSLVAFGPYSLFDYIFRIFAV